MLDFSDANGSVPLHRYTVKVDPTLSELQVNACFFGKPPPKLSAASSRAKRYLTKLRVGNHLKTSNSHPDAVIVVGNVSDEGCIDYDVDARAATRAMRAPSVQHRSDDLLLRAGTWLWLPEKSPTDIELRFLLPEGLAVSAPWRLIERAAKRTVYRLGQTPYDWPALVAIGRFEVQSLEVPGAVLRLAVLNSLPPADPHTVRAWVRHGALSLTALYGRFPVASLQVLVVPMGRQEEAVPWGQVLRGGSPAIHLFIDQTRSLQELSKDWTLVHELSHTLLPYIRHTEPWLYEGIATYYQNVLQARAGTLSQQSAWQKLHEGFQRGIQGTYAGITLAEASESMVYDHAFMRVYWSGAAIALLADFALRQRGQSLDQALSDLQRCCLPSYRQWTAREIMRQFDALTDTRIFSTLHDRFIHSDTFPELGLVYRQLGLKVTNKTIRFDDTAPLASIRKAVTGGESSAPLAAISARISQTRLNH